MSLNAVTTAIKHSRRVIGEWEEAARYLDGISWREDQTRYAIIDPILRALGWKTEEPRQCHPEYFTETGGRVDYALFRNLDLATIIEKGMPAPDIIIEAKVLGRNLTTHLNELEKYAQEGFYPMTEGLAVLTNGTIWHIYEVQDDGTLPPQPKECVDIEQEGIRRAAEKLHQLLGRGQAV